MNSKSMLIEYLKYMVSHNSYKDEDIKRLVKYLDTYANSKEKKNG